MRIFTDLQHLPSFQNTVLTIGSFDGVHTGHRRILEQVQTLARAHGSESVVLTFEPHPRTVLQPDDPSFKLISTSAEKIALLQQCGVDNVVLAPFTPDFARQTAQEYVEDFLIRHFHPKFIVIGYDHRFGADRQGNIDFLKKYETDGAFSLVEIPAQQVDEIAVSSSKIRKALDATEVAYANRLLGHPYLFSGMVMEGNKIGRTLGYPTANIQIADRYKLVLPQGIYAARVRILPPADTGVARTPALLDACAEMYHGMLYIGHRPSIAGANGKSIEVNLLDFDGDLYGRELTVEVLDYIRPDKKLDGMDALKDQIAADKQAILERLKALDPDFTPGLQVKTMPDAPAVVILNYNTRRHLEAFLPSVVQYSPGARIIVADNGSPDDSVAFVRQHYPTVELLDLQQNYGFAQGYNQALERVQGGIYIILNSDVEVTPGWMDPVLKAMQANPNMAIAQPKILAWNDKNRFEYAGAAGGWIDFLGYPFCRGRIFSHNEVDDGQYNVTQACFWAAGAAFFVRADVYHRFGGFDGDYFAHNEEIDLCWRLKRAGYQVWCIPESVVYHLGGGTLEYENPRKVFLNFRNSLFTLLKNESWAKLLWLLPARLVLDGVAGVRFALKGQFRAILAIIRAHFSFYKNIRMMLHKRRVAAAIVEKERIGPADRKGVYPGSIVFAHYIRRIKQFSQLW